MVTLAEDMQRNPKKYMDVIPKPKYISEVAETLFQLCNDNKVGLPASLQRRIVIELEKKCETKLEVLDLLKNISEIQVIADVCVSDQISSAYKDKLYNAIYRDLSKAGGVLDQYEYNRNRDGSYSSISSEDSW